MILYCCACVQVTLTLLNYDAVALKISIGSLNISKRSHKSASFKQKGGNSQLNKERKNSVLKLLRFIVRMNLLSLEV